MRTNLATERGMRMKKLAVLASALIVSALALAACGGGSDNSSTTASSTSSSAAAGGGGAAQTLKVSADPSGQLAYEQKSLSAKAGSATVDFTNDSSTGHDVAIEDSSGKQLAVTDIVTGGNASTSVDLKPGTYTFFCTVDSHRQAGMEGTLTVK